MVSVARPVRALSILGTRPEAIKLAQLVLRMKADPRFAPVVCLTAQHRELLDEPLALFGVRADFDLDVMRRVQDPVDLAARVLVDLARVVREVKPDVVVVQGDTTTAFCGAFVAFHERVKVAHVEAGLRTGCRHEPFPEEINRRLITPLADFHFAPTAAAEAALLAEGCARDSVILSGNPVVDAVLAISARPDPPGLPVLDANKRLVLVTSHRREHHGEVQIGLFRALRRVVERFADVEIVFPVHPHPRVRQSAEQVLAGVKGVHLLPPLSYHQFIALLRRAVLVLTDSGGVQEEAPSLGAAVLVLRNTTERREGIEAGNALLVGTDPERVFAEAERLLSDSATLNAMRQVRNPYGDGHACERICETLAARLLQTR